ncbi:MAG: GNAT family N-acetyltransferase [Candidatus Firestonebacteria bacterium]
MDEIKVLEKSEFDELIEFLNKIFKKDMEKEYCHVFRCDDEKFMKNSLIIKDKGKIIAHIGIFPMKIIVQGNILNCGGIGGVSTDDAYRGHGLMTKLINAAILEMKKRKYEISFLWGDRKRYGNFGWEIGGRRVLYTLSKRSVLVYPAIKTRIRKYDGEQKDLQKMMRMHEKEIFNVKHTKRDYNLVFNRKKHETYLAVQDNQILSYLTLTGEGNTRKIQEYGGMSTSLSDIIKYLFEIYNLESLTACSPYVFSCLSNVILKGATSYEIHPIAKVKILNLKSTLSKFLPQMQIKRDELNSRISGVVTLEMWETDQNVTLDIGRKIKIIDKEVQNKVALNEHEMVRLLFGLMSPSKMFDFSKAGPVLDTIFPLDFYISELDMV